MNFCSVPLPVRVWHSRLDSTRLLHPVSCAFVDVVRVLVVVVGVKRQSNAVTSRDVCLNICHNLDRDVVSGHLLLGKAKHDLVPSTINQVVIC